MATVDIRGFIDELAAGGDKRYYITEQSHIPLTLKAERRQVIASSGADLMVANITFSELSASEDKVFLIKSDQPVNVQFGGSVTAQTTEPGAGEGITIAANCGIMGAIAAGTLITKVGIINMVTTADATVTVVIWDWT